MVTRNHHWARDDISLPFAPSCTVYLTTPIYYYMKHSHHDFDSLLKILRHNPARFICFADGLILDKHTYFGVETEGSK